MLTMKNLSFLLGAGASIPAGMPSTAKITERVLSGEGINRGSAMTYHEMPPMYGGVFPDEYKPRVLSLITLVKRHTDNFYKIEERESNYEDIYSVIQQAYDSEMGEFENPVAQPFIDMILKESEHLLKGKKREIREKWELHELFSEALRYISGVLSAELFKIQADLMYLEILGDSINDDIFDYVNIFTLNYDLVLPKYLDEKKISYTDGFTDDREGMRYYKPEMWNLKKFKTKLFKLHGSFNWYDFEYIEKDRRVFCVGSPMNNDPRHQQRKGQRLDCRSALPLLLVGTLNKAFEYTSGIFLDMQCLMKKKLKSCGALVVSGYSFNDKIINSRIIDWYNQAESNKLMIVHPCTKELIANARPAAQRMLGTFKENPNIEIIEKKIEEATWKEIKRNILK